MSSYTMQLKEYIESWTQDKDGLSIADKIEAGRTKLFDFNYPIFDENYKKDFETHFIRNFYNREIGAETEGLFKFNLETWLIINMPFFNKLFESELLDYNPLQNSDVEVSNTKSTDNKTSSSSNGTGHSTSNNQSSNNSSDFKRNVESNNPDTRLQLQTNGTNPVIEYASAIDEVSDTASNNGTSNTTSDNTKSHNSNVDINETQNFNQKRAGKIGIVTYAKMLQEHRDTFLRIEKQMFNEMQQLFMLVY